MLELLWQRKTGDLDIQGIYAEYLAVPCVLITNETIFYAYAWGRLFTDIS